MDYEKFGDWLQNSKGYSKRASSNVLSRCKRVERIFKQPIDRLASHNAVDKTLQELKEKADKYLKQGANKVTAVGIVRTAVKLAHQFTFRGQAKKF